MEDDDLMPSDGTFLGGVPREPLEQIVARKKEKAASVEALPILEELVAQFQEDIDFYGSVDSIPAEIKVDPEKFLIVHNANELVRDALKVKMEYVQSLIDTHAPSR